MSDGIASSDVPRSSTRHHNQTRYVFIMCQGITEPKCFWKETSGGIYMRSVLPK